MIPALLVLLVILLPSCNQQHQKKIIGFYVADATVGDGTLRLTRCQLMSDGWGAVSTGECRVETRQAFDQRHAAEPQPTPSPAAHPAAPKMDLRPWCKLVDVAAAWYSGGSTFGTIGALCNALPP